ncbi:aspartic-type endopeptidase [Fusarium albosuccineum]|uniref:Aspartic-type endopeptidase n=1 Tax=Fusarium albosuccineum TaxID=1237068 RepID=A0A8H4LF36_9HYPO|nr:aspartic-type endopeptidase [Fusarium albosuccineum]
MASSLIPLIAMRLWTILFFLAGFSSAADNCIPSPLALPMENVTLHSGYVRRGVAISVGEPAQKLAFIPRWNNNNTFVYGPKCGQANTFTRAECNTWRGGLYEPKNWTIDGTLKKDYLPVSENWASNTYNMFTSTLRLGDAFTLKDFPMAQPVDPNGWELLGWSPQHILGMGPDSTLLSSLRNAGRIASKSVGYYWGTDSANSKGDTPGSFVLGGYDRAKTYGDGHQIEYTLGRVDCLSKMMVSISDLVLNFPNGTSQSIFPSDHDGSTLDACIYPHNPNFMKLGGDPWFDNLLAAIDNKEMDRSREQGVDYWNILLDPEKPIFKGDITVRLNTGLDSTVPNDQFMPVIRIDRMNSGLPSLGRYFLTAAYLATNEDAATFTLWKANPTSDQDLVALDTNNKAVDSQNLCTTPPVTSVLAEPDEGQVSEVAEDTASPSSTPRSDSIKLAFPSQAYPHYIPQELGATVRKPAPIEMP